MKLTLALAACTALLAGCVNDAASYLVGGKEEHIMLHRVQDWPWQDTVSLTIAPTRMPECRGGLTVADVPADAPLKLYRAPDEYAEPIYILQAGAQHFAISTASCRVQRFAAPPADLGTPLGAFQVADGAFRFAPPPR